MAQRARRKPTRRSYSNGRRGRKRSRVQAFAASRNESTVSAGSKASTADVDSKPAAKESSTNSTDGKQKIDDNDRLDVYAYYGGREGQEPRHRDTGQLRHDVQPTDTNHNARGPKSLVTSVVIEFPLEETDKGRKYRETLEWDLSCPEMPTPIHYAMQVGEQFGLSYSQTMDLAESIQKQIETFCHSQCSYTPALLLDSPQPKPSPLAMHLYGDVTGMGQTGGHCFPYHHKQPSTKHSSSLQRSRSSSSVVTTTKPTLSTATTTTKPSTTKRAKPVTDEVLHQQIRSRLRKESEQEAKEKCANSDAESMIRLVENQSCHLCERVLPKCGAMPCQIQDHVLCAGHLLYQFGVALADDSKSKCLNYCPICSLECPTRQCTRLLKQVTTDFRQHMRDQPGATPDTIVFPNLLGHCRSVSAAAARRLEYTKRKVEDRPKVPKLPPSELPKDTGEIDFSAEYRTRYTADGPVQSNAPVAEAKSVTTVVENGNIDFCIVCDEAGDTLLPCAFCPRTYHTQCLPNDFPVQGDDAARWECPACVVEKDGLPGVDGSSSLQEITTVYSAGSKVLPEDSEKLRLLSVLNDMLQALISYDFGYMFESPVDAKSVPNYKKIVKKPMDLGTISTRLLKGSYKKLVGDVLEDVAVAVLKDVELVWHNCFLYNADGSAVHRMATVQSKRADEIREKSYEKMLSEKMKTEIQDYRETLSRERSALKTLKNKPTSQQHQLGSAVNGTRTHRKRPIAVLDPDDGSVVRVYHSASAASSAVVTLLSTDHPCEWNRTEISNLSKFRRVVLVECSAEPALLVYGYRWLFLDELHDGKVKFPEGTRLEKQGGEIAAKRSMVSVTHGAVTRMYTSVEEALSYPGVKHSVQNLRNDLEGLETTPKVVVGCSWSVAEIGPENPSTDRVVFVKEDLANKGMILVEYPNEHAAFCDWRDSMEASLAATSDKLTLDSFRLNYLDSDKNLDGLRWRKISTNPRRYDDADLAESRGVCGTSEKTEQTQNEHSPHQKAGQSECEDESSPKGETISEGTSLLPTDTEMNGNHRPCEQPHDKVEGIQIAEQPAEQSD